MEKTDLLDKVNRYYSDKVRTHGPTPAGVDWNSYETQELRFVQLCKVIEQNDPAFSVLDFGCGFGSMYDYLKSVYNDFSYCGFDISDEMINQAVIRNQPNSHLSWVTKLGTETFDYTIASGVFSVKQDENEEKWLKYILDTLHELDLHSKKGFSFNALTKYSDSDKMRDNLYYADPLFLFDYCKKNFSKYVALLHDYPIYEFSILVKK